MFKRRDKQPWWEIAARLLWPRGGWGRAFGYIRHRVTRLPDSPEKIARGIAAGVFVSFTPFFGTHFLLAALVAKILRGNILAGLLATFFGNPLTYVPIAMMSLQSGNWILGREHNMHGVRSIGGKFAHAWLDLWRNFKAMFTDAQMDWAGLAEFYHDLFLPFLVGGIPAGILWAVGCFYLSAPFIRAYQKRRRSSLVKRRGKRLAQRGVSSGNLDAAR